MPDIYTNPFNTKPPRDAGPRPSAQSDFWSTAPRPGESSMPNADIWSTAPRPGEGAPPAQQAANVPPRPYEPPDHMWQGSTNPSDWTSPPPWVIWDKTYGPNANKQGPGPVIPGGLPGPVPPSPGDVTSTWQSLGYVDADGKVTLPWGQRVTLTEAMNMYYKDRKPNANEVPPWAKIGWQNATGTPVRYFNQIPKDLRGVFQQLLDAAYTNSQTKPDVSYMSGQSAYR